MKRRICLAVVTALLIFGSYATVQAITSSELEQRRAELKNQINQAGKSLENVNLELTENLEAISNLNEEIGEYETQIETISKNLKQIEAKIKITENSLQTIQERYNHQKELFQARIVYMYEAGETRYLDVLLNSKSIVDFITRYYLISEIAQYDQDMLKRIRNEKEQIEQIEQNLKVSKENLKTIKAEQKKITISLENAKVVRNSYVNSLNNIEKKIQEEINIYQQELDLVELEILMAALENTDTRYVGGTFAWPAPGYYTITSQYGMRIHPILKSYRKHTGTDIGAPMGSYAIAANDRNSHKINILIFLWEYGND